MEHFLEGIAPLRHWYINPNEKSNKYKSFRYTFWRNFNIAKSTNGFWLWVPVDVLFLDITMTLLGFRPLNQWIWTFQRHLWTYFWVWNWRRNLIQLFQFAPFILSFELDVRHITVTIDQLIIKTNTILLCHMCCV